MKGQGYKSFVKVERLSHGSWTGTFLSYSFIFRYS